MQIIQTNEFKKAVKRLHANQKKDLDDAIKTIMQNTKVGEAKIGDLSGIFVYKFKMVKQLTLLAYSFANQTITLTLLGVGSHENAYRDLKKSL